MLGMTIKLTSFIPVPGNKGKTITVFRTEAKISRLVNLTGIRIASHPILRKVSLLCLKTSPILPST